MADAPGPYASTFPSAKPYSVAARHDARVNPNQQPAMKFVWTLLSLIAVGYPARAAVFTNIVSADAFVRAAAPASNYGGAGALSVSGANAVNASGVTNGIFDTFIRFNTAAMTENFNSRFGSNNWVITGATLRVTEVGAPNNAIFNRGAGSFEIRWIADDSWAEGPGTPSAPATAGITYSDEATLLDAATDAVLGTFANAGVDGTLSFSLVLSTAFVNDLAAGGDMGLYLTATDPETGFTFNSRSYGATSARPFLEVSAAPGLDISAVHLAGTKVVLTAATRLASGSYYLLSSTNVALPPRQWTPVATNLPATNGVFSVTVTNAAGVNALPQRFFILQAQ
jgi:hypothetical protein